MKLGTHEERILALEAVFDSANGIEKATIVDLAARLDREKHYEAQNQGTAYATLAQRNAN